MMQRTRHAPIALQISEPVVEMKQVEQCPSKYRREKGGRRRGSQSLDRGNRAKIMELYSNHQCSLALIYPQQKQNSVLNTPMLVGM